VDSTLWLSPETECTGARSWYRQAARCAARLLFRATPTQQPLPGGLHALLGGSQFLVQIYEYLICNGIVTEL